MTKSILFVSGTIAAIGVALLALPSRSAALQEQEDVSPEVKAERLPKVHELKRIQIDGDRVLQDAGRALEQYQGALAGMEALTDAEIQQVTIFDGEEGPSWLGVETHEVTAENAKELKLPAERGVVVAGGRKDCPAAKAGLREKDVITEVNGQRVEGAAQFRRMIHEIPAGRAAQLTVWREGRAQTLSATLGKAEERHEKWMGATPGAFAFRMPEVQIPKMPSMDLGEGMGLVMAGRPRLGIDAEDIGGQLGSFFGAPDGEGILVRSLGDLRQKLASQNDAKTAKIGVLRNRSEVTLSVELPERTSKATRRIMQRTNI